MAKRGRKPKKEQNNVENPQTEENQVESWVEPVDDTPSDYSPYEAAEALRVNEMEITRWIQHGKLILNHRKNITAESLEAWKAQLGR